MNRPLFRPPAEAESLILPVDQGCPHNRCSFCGMYRGVPYRRGGLDRIETMARAAARHEPDARRIFLADGDVMRRPFEELRAILLLLNRLFPRLARVSLYANGSSIAARSAEELRTYRQWKLHTLYMGLESGSDTVLARCRKAETAEEMVNAARTAQAAGLRMSVMILLGLGGAEGSREHAARTAEALNAMQPRLLSALRVIPVEGTELHDEIADGRFRPLTEWEAVAELRDLVAGLDLQGTVFRANHVSNVMPVEARFPRDQAALLAKLDEALKSNALDRHSPGRTPLYL